MYIYLLSTINQLSHVEVPNADTSSGEDHSARKLGKYFVNAYIYTPSLSQKKVWFWFFFKSIYGILYLKIDVENPNLQFGVL